MSDKFNGFSQDDIKRVSQAKNKKPLVIETVKPAFRGQHNGMRRLPEKWSKSTESLKKQQQTNRRSATSSLATESNAGATKVPVDSTIDETMGDLDRSMSKSIEEALFYLPKKQAKVSGTSDKNDKSATSANDTNESSILQLPPMDANVSSTSTAASMSEETDSSILQPQQLEADSPFKGISLKDFEVHRKMIQEQNKQKKELLYKAIEHHSQKTAAETRKIEEIKVELAKLDNDLAVDVAILRKQIDNACIHFTNIEKHYMKIESQFLKAKIDLHNAAERKELLTEHLCTVIAHNEDRKAQKLSELMEKVGLAPGENYEPTSTNA